jgi:hypothetical protein
MDDQINDLVDLLSTIYIFDMLSEDQLLEVADRLDTQLFNEGEIIFEEDSYADGFYIISSGRVRLQIREHKGYKELSIQQRGSYFGEEGLANNQKRQVSAIAASNTIVHRLKIGYIEELIETYPEIKASLRLSIDSYRLLLKRNFNWLAPRESVQFISRKHSVFLWLRMMIPLILGGGILGGTAIIYTVFGNNTFFFDILLALECITIIGWFLWTIIDWANDYSIITNRRIISLDKVAFFYESRQEAPLDAILSIETKTDQTGRIFGYGNILIRTFTGVVIFRQLSQPDLVIRLINEERSKSKILSKRSQRNTKEDFIRDRLGFKERLIDPFEDDTTNEQAEVPPTVTSGKLSSLISTFFRLRMEENGVITYRTHWFILLKKIFYPSLLLLILFFLFVFSAFGILEIFPFSSVFIFILCSGFVISLWWLYQYIDWRNDRYIITRDQIIDVNRKPLGQEQKRSAPLKNIQTVEYKRKGLISLILNFGTVYIRVGDTTFTFDFVYNPSETQSEIFERYQEFLGDQKQKDQDNLKKEMSEWIEIYHNVVQKDGSQSNLDSEEDISGYNIEEY